MSNILEINVVVTSTDIGTPQACAVTPLLGGAGREALVKIPVLPLTSVFELQGAPAIDASTGDEPEEASDLWETLATISSTSDQIQEIELPELIRWETTTADGDGPNVKVYLEGVQ